MSAQFSVDEEGIVREFLELTAIDAESFSERAMADCLKKKLVSLGFQVWEDNAGAILGGNAGNVCAYLPGELPGDPLLFSAHMDTVKPGTGKKALAGKNGVIRSDGTAVLGSDDAAGIAEILGGIRAVRAAGIPHRDIELIFPVAEESYGRGSAHLDYSRIRARECYVLDLSGAVGTAAFAAPTILSFTATVRGREAHAGFEPEKGIHAITLAAKALAQIRQGHLDENTTFNIGTIEGGEASNIVPAVCTCRGEVRSLSHRKALLAADEAKKAFEEAIKGSGAVFSMNTEVALAAYETPVDAPVAERFRQACIRLGIQPELTSTFGGSDLNHYAEHGISGLVLSCGMYKVHTVEEYTTREDLRKGAALVAQLLLG